MKKEKHAVQQCGSVLLHALPCALVRETKTLDQLLFSFSAHTLFSTPMHHYNGHLGLHHFSIENSC